jgi:hypothetical protein
MRTLGVTKLRRGGSAGAAGVANPSPATTLSTLVIPSPPSVGGRETCQNARTTDARRTRVNVCTCHHEAASAEGSAFVFGGSIGLQAGEFAARGAGL